MPSINASLYITFFILGAVALIVIGVFVYWYDFSRRPVSGRHILLGQIGRAKQNIPKGKLGKVYVFGEYWEALCDTDLKDEDAVKVIEVHDKFLKVVPSDQLPEMV
jgi:membrane protein implicated in regulation of membrane protease activity